MDDVADMELCAELEKLTGWKDTNHIWMEWPSHLHFDGKPHEDYKWQIQTRGGNTVHARNIVSAYNTDYLLRVLQSCVFVTLTNHGSHTIYWHVEAIIDDLDNTVEMKANKPANALCKLAIELVKAGILK